MTTKQLFLLLLQAARLSTEPMPNAQQQLLNCGLITDVYEGQRPAPGYALTERGRVYVDALCALPLPVQAWRMPIPQREVERTP